MQLLLLYNVLVEFVYFLLLLGLQLHVLQLVVLCQHDVLLPMEQMDHVEGVVGVEDHSRWGCLAWLRDRSIGAGDVGHLVRRSGRACSLV